MEEKIKSSTVSGTAMQALYQYQQQIQAIQQQVMVSVF
jgi:hypothetical protein